MKNDFNQTLSHLMHPAKVTAELLGAKPIEMTSIQKGIVMTTSKLPFRTYQNRLRAIEVTQVGAGQNGGIRLTTGNHAEFFMSNKLKLEGIIYWNDLSDWTIRNDLADYFFQASPDTQAYRLAEKALQQASEYDGRKDVGFKTPWNERFQSLFLRL